MEDFEMEGFNINGKILLGIDHGYGNMKTRHTVFKSGVKCYASEPAIASNVLEYNGKYYVIGESHKVFIASKNEDEDYYILTLAATCFNHIAIFVLVSVKSIIFIFIS